MTESTESTEPMEDDGPGSATTHDTGGSNGQGSDHRSDGGHGSSNGKGHTAATAP